MSLPKNSDVTYPAYFRQMLLAGVLTFAVPATQWLISKLPAPSSYRGSISSLLIILCICLWYGKIRNSSFLPAASFWKALVYVTGMVVMVLLAFNIWNGPVSKITGQARSPFEVTDVIVLVPVAEELIFRGILWSIFERLLGSRSMLTLAATSLLFGVEHLGYWAQAGLPLPFEAILHALSMVGAGICFGALRWRSRSLAVPTVIHMLANGAILLTQ